MAFAKGINVSKNTALEPKQLPLQQIDQLCKQLGQLQHDLEAAIDSFADNKSLLSRAAAYWGQWPLWVQITAGFLLAFSLLMISLAVSIVAMGGYIVVAFLLNDHHSLLMHNTQKFKTIMENLTNLLGSLIGLITNIHGQFKNEIESMQERNQQMQRNISHLKEQTAALIIQIDGLTNAKGRLETVIDTHERTITDLNKINQEQSELFQRTERQLAEVTEHSEQAQVQLSEKIRLLEQTRAQMETEHEQMIRTVLALKNTVISLSNPTLLKEEHQELLKQKLHEFVTSKEKDLSQFAVSTSQINLELEITQKQLHESLQQQASLRHDLESLIQEFATLINLHEQNQTVSKDQYSLEAFKKISFFMQQGTPALPINPPEHVNTQANGNPL